MYSLYSWNWWTFTSKFFRNQENEGLQYLVFYNETQVILENYPTDLVKNLSD